MNGVLDLRNSLHLPASKNFWLLKKSSALALAIHASADIGGGGQPNFDREGCIAAFDCRKGERVDPAIKFDIRLLLDGFVLVLRSLYGYF